MDGSIVEAIPDTITQIYLTANINKPVGRGGGVGLFSCHYTVLQPHRRRIALEDKAKFVASVWGGKFVQFLAALTVLPRSIRKNWKNSTFSFK